MQREQISDQLFNIQARVDSIGFKGQNEYDLHLREEITDWIILNFNNKNKKQMEDFFKSVVDKNKSTQKQIEIQVAKHYNKQKESTGPSLKDFIPFAQTLLSSNKKLKNRVTLLIIIVLFLLIQAFIGVYSSIIFLVSILN